MLLVNVTIIRYKSASVCLLKILFAAACLAVPLVAPAQNLPSKPVRIVVPVAAGGGVDTIARSFAPKLSDAWKVPVIVENRVGAGNVIGADYVAKSAPDGTTLLFSSSSLAINAVLFRKLPFDPLKDLAPVSQINGSQFTLAMNPKVPAANVLELIAYARSQPNKLNFGSTGPGSIAHLIAEVFRIETGIDVVHVPYKGDAPLVPALLSGEVHYAFLPGSAVMQHVRAGRLLALAVTGRNRAANAPDLPTMIEAGVPNFDFETWVSVFAPGGTPREVLAAVSNEIAKVLRLPDIVERLPAWGGEAVGSSPEVFAVRYRSDIAKFAKVVREAKVPLLD